MNLINIFIELSNMENPTDNFEFTNDDDDEFNVEKMDESLRIEILLEYLNSIIELSQEFDGILNFNPLKKDLLYDIFNESRKIIEICNEIKSYSNNQELFKIMDNIKSYHTYIQNNYIN
jgi:hypothetical protein